MIYVAFTMLVVSLIVFGFVCGFLYMDYRQERTLAEITNLNLGQINNTLKRLTVRLRRPKKKHVDERKKTLKKLSRHLEHFV